MKLIELAVKNLEVAKTLCKKANVDKEAVIIIDELINQLSGSSNLIGKGKIDSDIQGQYYCIRRDEYKHGLNDEYGKPLQERT